MEGSLLRDQGRSHHVLQVRRGVAHAHVARLPAVLGAGHVKIPILRQAMRNRDAASGRYNLKGCVIEDVKGEGPFVMRLKLREGAGMFGGSTERGKDGLVVRVLLVYFFLCFFGLGLSL